MELYFKHIANHADKNKFFTNSKSFINLSDSSIKHMLCNSLISVYDKNIEHIKIALLNKIKIMHRICKYKEHGTEIMHVMKLQTNYSSNISKYVSNYDSELTQLSPIKNKLLKFEKFFAIEQEHKIVCSCLVMDSPEGVLISDLFTLKDYRRKGMATKLMKHIHHIYINKKIALIVSKNNSTAISFYKKLGYFVTHSFSEGLFVIGDDCSLIPLSLYST